MKTVLSLINKQAKQHSKLRIHTEKGKKMQVCSTWSDFTHIAVQSDLQEVQGDSEVSFSEIDKNDEGVLHDPESVPQFNHEKGLLKESVEEDGHFSYSLDKPYETYVKIPQHLNSLDLLNHDSIEMVTPGHTKQVIENLSIKTTSESSGVNLQRMRCENILIQTGKQGLKASSNLEGKTILVKSEGNIEIRKKLSVLEKAHFITFGSFKAGAIYGPQEEGLIVLQEYTGEPIEISNLHGNITIKAKQNAGIKIEGAEAASFDIHAPDTEVFIHLKSLHKSSIVKAKSLKLLIEKGQKDFDIVKVGKEEDYDLSQDNKTFFTQLKEEILVEEADSFEIMKRKIAEKLRKR